MTQKPFFAKREHTTGSGKFNDATDAQANITNVSSEMVTLMKTNRLNPSGESSYTDFLKCLNDSFIEYKQPRTARVVNVESYNVFTFSDLSQGDFIILDFGLRLKISISDNSGVDKSDKWTFVEVKLVCSDGSEELLETMSMLIFPSRKECLFSNAYKPLPLN